MTVLLEKAIKRVSALPEGEQDAIAMMLLEEIESEKRWQSLFSKSQDKLTKLADEALAEFEQGKTKPFNINEL